MQKKRFLCLALVFLLVGGGAASLFQPVIASASAIDDLNAKIADHNATIKALDDEIATYQKQLDSVSKQKQSLQQTVAELSATQRTLLAQISKTENQIDTTNLQINELQLQIADKQDQIGGDNTALGTMVRQINQTDDISTLELFLTNQHLSDSFDVIERLLELQGNVTNHVHDLQALQASLSASKQDAVNKKNDLVTLEGTLSDQKKLVEINTAATNKLLASTKSQESTYQKTIAAKEKLRDSFQQELTDFESQLKLTIDQSALPPVGSGVLHWPLDKITITQRFGNTAFAATGAYNGQGHNGVDFAAAIGTPVKAALDGTITDIGDTDAACPGASYGKWVLIKHPNGLSTLYAHLSLIKVSKGDSVVTGQVIAYSGFTGYATGPHLHFTVYATQGVEVIDRPSAVCHATYHLPVADLKAYLDPLLYL